MTDGTSTFCISLHYIHLIVHDDNLVELEKPHQLTTGVLWLFGLPKMKVIFSLKGAQSHYVSMYLIEFVLMFLG